MNRYKKISSKINNLEKEKTRLIMEALSDEHLTTGEKFELWKNKTNKRHFADLYELRNTDEEIYNVIDQYEFQRNDVIDYDRLLDYA